MWRGSVTFETPMLWAHRLPRLVRLRRPHRRHPRVAAARLPRLRLLLRRRALPLRGVRHRRVRDVRRLLLLVAEVDRQDAQRALGKWHFWMLFIGFHMTFLIQHWLGVVGMPRRYCELPADRRRHLDEPGLDHRRRDPRRLDAPVPAQRLDHRTQGAAGDRERPVGLRRSLEWATSCPPPRHNFTSIPRIRTESPAFDLNHPEAGCRSASGR